MRLNSHSCECMSLIFFLVLIVSNMSFFVQLLQDTVVFVYFIFLVNFMVSTFNNVYGELSIKIPVLSDI